MSKKKSKRVNRKINRINVAIDNGCEEITNEPMVDNLYNEFMSEAFNIICNNAREGRDINSLSKARSGWVSLPTGLIAGTLENCKRKFSGKELQEVYDEPKYTNLVAFNVGYMDGYLKALEKYGIEE